jgi:NADH-quinone oxidoreductase subunit M
VPGPHVLLDRIWGGPRRVYAAIKFFLYTLIGSLLMLGRYHGPVLSRQKRDRTGSFDLLVIKNVLAQNPLSSTVELLMFGAFALAFAIKVPLFPFHTWLPDAHVEAPTAGSVILAGVLLKLGTFGFIRYCIPLFPYASATLAPADDRACRDRRHLRRADRGDADGREETRRLLVRESLGICRPGHVRVHADGNELGRPQMINHGISTGALFLLVGMIYERRHTREIAHFGGLWEQMPLFGRIFLIVTFSSIALPLTNGFVGEFLILLGSYQSQVPLAKGATVLATTGVIWSAVYMLWMFQRVMYGPVDKPKTGDCAT